MSFERPPAPKTGTPERKKLGDLMTPEQKRVLARKLRVMTGELADDAVGWSAEELGDNPTLRDTVFEKIILNNILWKEFVLELAGMSVEEYERLTE